MNRYLNELSERTRDALEMGGEARVQRQHDNGKLTVRERLDILFDAGTFNEYAMLAYGKSHNASGQEEILLTDGLVIGYGDIRGNKIAVVAEDFTIRGGSLGHVGMQKLFRIVDLVKRERVPLVMLQDGAGARADDGLDQGEGVPLFSIYADLLLLSGLVPMAAIIMGPCSGHSALMSTCADFIVMTKDTAMLAAAGPKLVAMATGQELSKEELGGAPVHAEESGTVDRVVDDDAVAIELVKNYLSYFPPNAYAWPPFQSSYIDPKVNKERLLEILPSESSRAYDMHNVIDALVDHDSFLEMKPDYARNLIAGPATIAGHPVGIVANQPIHSAGALTSRSNGKLRKFIDLCNAFHLPTVFLVDVPGVMPGKVEEANGILRTGMAAGFALAHADTQMISVVLRKAYGVGGALMCGGRAGQSTALVWPTADFSSLPASARAEFSRSPDATAEEFAGASGPLRSMNSMTIDEIIDPRDTRVKIISALELGENRRTQNAKPASRYGILP